MMGFMREGPLARDVYLDLLEALYADPNPARLTYEDALADAAMIVHGYRSREDGAVRVAADLADMENERG